MFRARLANLTINSASFPTGRTVLLIQDAYNVTLDNVFSYNVRGKGIHITTRTANVLDVVLNRVRVVGENTRNATNCVQIATGSNITLVAPVLELCATGLEVTGASKVNVLSPYMERNRVGIAYQGTISGSLTVVGGLVESPGASGTAFTIRGSNATVISGRYNANWGLQAHLLGRHIEAGQRASHRRQRRHYRP